MGFENRKQIMVKDLTEEFFSQIVAYSFDRPSGLGGPGCVIMVSEYGESFQVLERELNSLNYYTEWKNIFPVLSLFTYEDRLDFGKEVEGWRSFDSMGTPVVIRSDTYELFKETLGEDKKLSFFWEEELIEVIKSFVE